MTKDRPPATVSYDNRGRVVIVTGGSSGIGAAVCRRFADSGATVICADIQPPVDKALIADHGSTEQTPVEYLHCDTASDASCRELVDAVVNRHGAIDVLVNNAAIQPPESYRPLHELDDEVRDRMIAINFTGYMRMAKAVLPLMTQQQRGVIVNMSSGQAHRTAREVPVYGPIKAGNVMQARQWALEYARQGIRVVSVSPGAIDTPLVRASLEAQGGLAALANRHPIGRIGRPDEVAATVLWLSSDDASFITGTDLEVDGGLGAFGAFADPYPE